MNTPGRRRPAEPLRPQRLLSQAVQDAARLQAPKGVGLDSAAVRQRMVQRLQASGDGSAATLAAMVQVPRHQFVDSALAAQAYEDTSLPIGWGQTISKPSVVARMISLLAQGRNARRAGHLGAVLEIGTGCGYQAAVLSLMATRVVSIERLAPLHEQARQRLSHWQGCPLTLVWGDGRLGAPAQAPFDTLIAAAGGDDLPAAWLEQLAVGGRLVAPVHSAAAGGHVLAVVDRDEQGWTHQRLEGVNFVPLKSGAE